MDCYDLQELYSQYYQQLRNAKDANSYALRLHYETEASYLLLEMHNHNCANHDWT